MALDKKFRKFDSKFCTKTPLSYKTWIRDGSMFSWFAMVVISIAVMTGLYSRAMYTLWAKGNNVERRHRQMVFSLSHQNVKT